MSTLSLNPPAGRLMNEVSYRCGQPMPGYIFEALKFIGKVGVVTRPTWYTYLCPGTDQWKREQLLNMVKRGLLVPHTCSNLKGAWVLTDWSASLLRGKGLSCVRPVPPSLIEHDEVVGTSVLFLKRSGICKDWLTENELKMRRLDQFLIENKDKDSKYPDAVFRMHFKGKLAFVALEYERTGKSTHRYRKILRQYSSLNSIEQILYVTEDESIKKRILSALRTIGDRSLSSRIAFIKGYEWKSNPTSAIFMKDNKATCLSELVGMTQI